jgi:putative SbcD/Mre11-related phosphoesterase
MRVLTDWELTPQRVAFHLPTRTAVVADLHLAYAEARQRGGDAVPGVALSTILAPLQAACAAHRARRLVIAGDLFESTPTKEITDELFKWLRNEGIDLTAVVPGNHDRDIEQSGRFPVASAGFHLGDWYVVHGHDRRPAGLVVQGHEHPFLRWGNGLTAPCYLVAVDHIVLPAFSQDAAGVNVLNGRRWSSYRCCAIAENEILDFGRLVDIRPAGKAETVRPGSRT